MVLEAANFTRVADPAHLAEARPAHGRLEPLGEGRRSARSRRSPRAPRPGSSSSSAAARMTPRPLDVSADAAAARARCACAWTASRTSPRSRSRSRARSRSSTASASIRAPDRARSTCACRRPASLDVTREIDVIEEIARIYGLEHVPSLLSVGSGGGLTRRQRVRRTVADACFGAGLTEAQTLSYVPADMPDRLGLGAGRPAPRHARGSLNPLSQEHSHLRTLLLPSLLEALARNAACGPRRPRALRDRAHLPSRRRARSCRASRGRSAP